MTRAEFADVRGALLQLRGSLESLRIAEGDSPYVRRLMNDLDRFQLDMEDVSGAGPGGGSPGGPRSVVRQGVPGAREVVRIADGPEHHVPWHEADDEGIGGHRR
ncbi:hypothetical protein [Streptomyces corynorhini]|uniref:Uncharacterized protein n=1 Tax=Streptomyces corynorhini TaxID=2282652 RepID=A0A370ATV4_9ACTN|nr:hypothetical protein [Streptomyces corynorhini]RDG31559.1 hypothetical protein DVH02_33315 [Streptomyces corynorhini]